MRIFKRAAALSVFIGLSCAGCQQQSATTDGRPVLDQQQQPPPLTGYGGFTLGSSFEDVVASSGASRFGAESVSECVREMATKGCLLFGSEGVTDLHDGIPYRIKLLFNRFGQLTDIELAYEQGGTISSGQCQSIVERTLDWAARSFGGFGYEPRRDAATDVRKTPSGVIYSFSAVGQGFLANLMPEGSAAGDSVLLRRHMRSMSYFLVVAGKNQCNVAVTLSEPGSVERGKWITKPATN